MKTISIGRDSSCGIIISDNRVSHRHATLRIYSSGKMEIVDTSKNGTKVDGVKIKNGMPCPVTRKSVVIFADAVQLDWSQVEDPLKYFKIAAIAVATIAVAAIVITLLVNAFSDKSHDYDDFNYPESAEQVTGNSLPVSTDATTVMPSEEQKEEETERAKSPREVTPQENTTKGFEKVFQNRNNKNNNKAKSDKKEEKKDDPKKKGKEKKEPEGKKTEGNGDKTIEIL